jgi:general secretion pathway protein J
MIHLPNPMIDQRPNDGFTLLEVLVALTVLGFLVVGLNQGVRTGLDFWSVQTRRIDQNEDLFTTARLIRNLLTSIPIMPAAANGGNQPAAIAFDGDADHLTFAGDLPTGLGGSEFANIKLMLREQRLVLLWTSRRPEFRAEPPAPREVELMRGVDRLQFAYWGRTSTGAGSEWLVRWRGPAPPTLIRMRVKFAKGDSRRWPDLIAAPWLSPPGI